MLNIYTARYSYKGPNRTDVTVKSAIPPWKVFAPTWDMVNAYLKSPKDETAERIYTLEYSKIVIRAFEENYKALATLLNSNETRVFVCFCKSGTFCHRVLLAKCFESIGATYHGEIP